MPREKWDVPLSSEFPSTDLAGSSGAYRATLWVNGFRKSTPPLPFLFCAQKSPETWMQDRSHLRSVLPCPVPGTCLASRRCPIRRLTWLAQYYSPDVPPDPDSRSDRWTDKTSAGRCVVLTSGCRIRALHQPHRAADVVPGHPRLPGQQYDRGGHLGDAGRRATPLVAEAHGRDARSERGGGR